MLHDVKHGDEATTRVRQRSVGEIGTGAGNSVLFPGDRQRLLRKIESEHIAPGQHAEQQSIAAADIDDVSRAIGIREGLADERDVIAQN